MSSIITPDHPDFYQILHSQLPPNWKSEVRGNYAYFAPDRHGVLTALSEDEIDPHLDDLDEEFEPEDEGLLWLPC